MNLSKKVAMILLFAALCLGGCGKQSFEMKVSVEHLTIPGLQKEYKLLFLTDTHIIVPKEGEACGERYEAFCNAQGVPAMEQFPQWISYANEQKVDAVLLGGDMIDSPSEENLAFLQEQLEALQMPYLYCPGNHDWNYEWDYMTENARENELPKLAPMMEGNTALHAMELGELSLVAVDDSSNQVQPSVPEEYEKLLRQGKPTILLCHIPLITQSVLGRAREVWASPVVLGAGNYGGIYPDENSQTFMEMTAKKDSPVQAILAGHVHFQDMDYYVGEKSIPQYVGEAGYNGSAIMLYISGSAASTKEK